MVTGWNRPSSRFSFGNLDAQQQSLYENNQSLAYQKLLDYYAQGNPNFASTILGRYLTQQQQQLSNRFVTEQSAQASRIAQEKQGFDTGETQRQRAAWDYDDQVKRLQAAYDTQNREGLILTPAMDAQLNQTRAELARLRANPITFTPGAFKSSETPLVFTRYLEQHADDLPGGFGMLTAGARGAQPGAFQVRRNVW